MTEKNFWISIALQMIGGLNNLTIDNKLLLCRYGQTSEYKIRMDLRSHRSQIGRKSAFADGQTPRHKPIRLLLLSLSSAILSTHLIKSIRMALFMCKKCCSYTLNQSFSYSIVSSGVLRSFKTFRQLPPPMTPSEVS